MKMFLFFLLVVTLGSCITQKKLEYLQSPVAIKKMKITEEDNNTFKKAEKHRIRPNDELLIKVSSFDDISFNYFSTQAGGNFLQASNELSINVISYSVDVEGFIFFPVVGKIKLSGLSLDQAGEKLQLVLRPYFDQPNVQIKFGYKKVSILGEVNVPGYYTYTKDQITILDALAMANDLTIHGDRKSIILLRNQSEDKVEKYEIDLTDDNSVIGYNYYLQPGDILYVKPRRSIKWSQISTPVSLLFSTITTGLLVYNAIQN